MLRARNCGVLAARFSPHASPLSSPSLGLGARRTYSDGYSRRRRGGFRRKLVYVGIASFLYVAATEYEAGDSPVYVAMKALPMRALSRLWGSVNNITLPTPLRAPLYNLWTDYFGCNLDEMRDPLESYPNLAAFFCRRLKDGVRPIADAELVSPADAKLSVCGEVTNGKLEQIKGMEYSLTEFLGTRPPNVKLYYCVLYLAPGDYHRIHSAADCTLTQRAHFPGAVYPVHPDVLRYVPSLFVRNERIVLSGRWKHGYFSLAPVGAYNVGSMRLSIPGDEELVTNLPERFRPTTGPLGTTAYIKPYPSLDVSKGQELARFELGSTVVLVFQVPKDSTFSFEVQPGERVRQGQALGKVIHPPRPSNTPTPRASQAVDLDFQSWRGSELDATPESEEVVSWRRGSELDTTPESEADTEDETSALKY